MHPFKDFFLVILGASSCKRDLKLHSQLVTLVVDVTIFSLFPAFVIRIVGYGPLSRIGLGGIEFACQLSVRQLSASNSIGPVITKNGA